MSGAQRPPAERVPGWSAAASRPGLTPGARRQLDRMLGLAPAPQLGRLRVVSAPAARPLPLVALDDLRRAVGTGQVHTDDAAVAAHTGGQSYLDLLERRGVANRSTAAVPPGAVVTPATAAEVGRVLASAGLHGLAVVPFGGGTSVVGGVRPVAAELAGRPVLALDLRRMDQLLEVDPVSLLVRVQPGLTGPALEELLAPHGLTLGHLPQSYEYATLGGYLATRSAGQASTGYGAIADLVARVELTTPVGPLQVGRGAVSAAGPDLRALVVGSEGAFGVITEATLRVRPRPACAAYRAYAFRSWDEGTAAVRRLAQGGEHPDVVRLSDPVETLTTLALAAAPLPARLYLRSRGVAPGWGTLLVLGWEGSGGSVRRRRAAARGALSTGVLLGRRPAEAWRQSRFGAPYLREELLDAGLLVETLETSASWTDLPRVHAATGAALTAALARPGRPPVVGAHVSHVYPHGASLYFTVLARQATDPVEQWEGAKAAATEALLAAGGTLTHHHSVGRDHARWLDREIGELGVRLLRTVKDRLDPQGVCNPGVLLAQPPVGPPVPATAAAPGTAGQPG